jgi:hypothetical protein
MRATILSMGDLSRTTVAPYLPRLIKRASFI